MKIEYTEEKLKEVVGNSQTLAQVLMEFNRNASGASYKTLKRKLKLWKISTSHFLTPSEVMRNNLKNGKIQQKSNDEVFTKNSKVSRSTVKKRILKEEILEYKCVKCGNKGEWMGVSLNLTLDHINGVNNDHRIENLRFMCPNCNSTLPTHCKGSEGLKKETKKIDGRTVKRDRTSTRKVKNRPSKETLILLVNETSFTSVGKKYGVSDNTIRKWIKS